MYHKVLYLEMKNSAVIERNGSCVPNRAPQPCDPAVNDSKGCYRIPQIVLGGCVLEL
jgi:hypothetical protein